MGVTGRMKRLLWGWRSHRASGTELALAELERRLDEMSAQLLQVRQEQGHLNRRIREVRQLAMMRDRLTLELVRESEDLFKL